MVQSADGTQTVEDGHACLRDVVGVRCAAGGLVLVASRIPAIARPPTAAIANSATAVRNISMASISTSPSSCARRIRQSALPQPVKGLSGGNQQKVVLAKWLTINPKLLILDEPTRGVDVGAKAEIYAIMHQLAREGMGILMVSSDLPEVLGMSDRIVVMHEGRIVAELPGYTTTQEEIMLHAAGLAA